LSDNEGYGVEINKNELIGKSVPIITEYTCIDHDANNNSILEINLLTGKKHQIRAHLAFYGHPVYGEQKYVSKKIRQMSKHQHQQLYSYKIQFVVTNKESILYYLNGKTISLDKDNIIDILKKI
jgi:23S rRNA pseudouridine955/2504/2580 synthase